MMLFTKRSFNFNLLILLHSINQSVAVAFSSRSPLIGSNKILNHNLVPSSSARSYGGFNRKFLYPTKRNYVYLNYKEAYGIRYDPSENEDANRFSLPQMEAPDESNAEGELGTMKPVEEPPAMSPSEVIPVAPEATDAPAVPDLNEPMPTEVTVSETTTECITEKVPTDAANMEANESSLSQTTIRKPTIAFTALNHRNSNKSKNNTTQIVRPISSIRETLNLIRKRVKQWFSSGVDLNAPLVNGQRFLNIFNIIKFENSECTSTQEMLEEMSGTCYHDYQCTEMGGTSIGECADGLGVCCICMSPKGIQENPFNPIKFPSV